MDTPAAIYVITRDEIAHSTGSSVPELLRAVPGLQVAQLTASTWGVSAHGFNNPLADKLLVLMDKRCVFSKLYTGAHWDEIDLPLSTIERIVNCEGEYRKWLPHYVDSDPATSFNRVSRVQLTGGRSPVFLLPPPPHTQKSTLKCNEYHAPFQGIEAAIDWTHSSKPQFRAAYTWMEVQPRQTEAGRASILQELSSGIASLVRTSVPRSVSVGASRSF